MELRLASLLALLPPSSPSVSAGACTLQSGVQFLGNDVVPPQHVSSHDVCCYVCGQNPNCKFFTYEGGVNGGSGPGSGGTCFQKNSNAPDASRQNTSCVSGTYGSFPPAPPPPCNVSISIGPWRSTTGPNFVCWNIDASENRQFFARNLSVAGSFGDQLARQAAILGKSQEAGYSLLRFGGTGNDYLTYAFDGTHCPPLQPTKQCLNETQWRDLLSFTEAASARMIFGLSMNTGHDRLESGRDSGVFPYPWDPSNARQILRWTIDAGMDELIWGLELGNEQNTKYSPQRTAHNFLVLHNLTLELWPDATRRPKLLGPDRHSFHTSLDCDSYLADFVKYCQQFGVPLYGLTHHEYIMVESNSFTSPSMLDRTGQIAVAVNRSVRAQNPDVAIFAGEIGPHNGGSPPCDHSVMRWANFGDSLWYADALGSKAKHGYQGFCRQDFIGADYGLADCSTGVPLPDYYTALTWASVMGQRVLDATLSAPEENTLALRVYAHCTSRSAPSDGASNGAVTVLVINLGNESTTVSFPSSVGVISREYVLTPTSTKDSSLINATGLLGTGVALNGKLLKLNADGSVPEIVGNPVGRHASVVPATAIAFFVLADAGHAACLAQPSTPTEDAAIPI